MISIPAYRQAGRLTAAMALAVAATLTGAHDGHGEQPPWQHASPWPDRVVVTLESAPDRSFAVSWRTDASVERPVARITRADAAPRFDRQARAIRAVTESVDLRKTKVGNTIYELGFPLNGDRAHYHSVQFLNLAPDTLYAYQVCGAEGHCSEWFHTRTAPAPDEKRPIRFIYLGDAQNGVLSHWARAVRAGFAAAPDANFILHAGDLVNRGSRDLEWAQWFKAVGFIHGMVPAVPLAGNHEYDKLEIDGEERRAALSILWRPQFRLPVEESLPDVLHETVYTLPYSDDLAVFVLDTQAGLIDTQAQWLDRALGESDARWKVVSMHHPVFSPATERDNQVRREAVLPVLRRHQVDLVLQGHDHAYSRGASALGLQRAASDATDESVGPVFVTSVSGAKMYEVKGEEWDAYAEEGFELGRTAENTQFFQLVDVTSEQLHYEAYTVTGELYDAFTLTQDETGRNRLQEAVDLPASRRHDNTVPYGSVEDLNADSALETPPDSAEQRHCSETDDDNDGC